MFYFRQISFVTPGKQCWHFRMFKQKFSSKQKEILIPIKDTHCFLVELFKKLKVDLCDCRTMADVIIEADKRGKYAHGVYSLPKYIKAIKKGAINLEAEPQIEDETKSVALVSGENALGPVVGNFCMNLAIEKAQEAGASLVCACNSNYFGMASYYSLLAAKKELIGLVMSNAPPIMVPVGGKEALVGSNPIAFAVKAETDDIFSLDIASTTVGKENVEWLLESCGKLPDEAALDSRFKPTKLPRIALKENKFLPFAIHKGYVLGCSIEMLCGVMTGANFSKQFNEVKPGCPPNIGHIFIVVDPNQFFCLFPKSFGDFLYGIREREPIDPEKPVRIPGDMSAYICCKSCMDGIPFKKPQINILKCLAKKYKIDKLEEYLC